MKLLRRHIPLTVIMLVSLHSCSDDKNYNDSAMYSDIVTIASTAEEQGTVFKFRRYDDSPEITLTDPRLTLKKDSEGLRVLLRYYSESGQPYTSGTIKTRAVSAINNDTTIIRPVERYNWDATPIYLHSVWRTGEYINMHLRVEYSETPRYFNLLVDSLSLEDAVAQLYLVHDKGSAPDNYLMEIYASFNIDNVWSQPTCEGIDIHINDSNLPKNLYKFKKQ